MVILAGIDEAGYGPILGPLVVSCSAFSIPENMVAADLWAVLKKSVAKTRKHLGGRVLIADSKKAYSTSIGIKHLQRTTLAIMKALGFEPQSFNQVLSYLCPDCFSRLADYPWHQNTENMRIDYDRADIRIASEVLIDDMTENKIKPVTLRSICLDTGYYNNLVSRTKNKANVLFSTAAILMQKLWDDLPGSDLQIIIDRQGGRSHYRKNLQRLFPEHQLSIIIENDNCSTYELKDDSRSMRVHFVTKADDRFLAVSLASMVSKYVREILIADINRYFLSFEPSLKPTAGYWQDGQRFIADIQTLIPNVKYDQNQLIRCR
ncbi:MAG: hypothetical protein WCZ89_07030 [Phycisphaerae bacterium]